MVERLMFVAGMARTQVCTAGFQQYDNLWGAVIFWHKSEQLQGLVEHKVSTQRFFAFSPAWPVPIFIGQI